MVYPKVNVISLSMNINSERGMTRNNENEQHLTRKTRNSKYLKANKIVLRLYKCWTNSLGIIIVRHLAER